jgi:hypothetical protein
MRRILLTDFCTEWFCKRPCPMKIRLAVWTVSALLASIGATKARSSAQQANAPHLPGTSLWAMPTDPAAEMVEGIHRRLDLMTAQAKSERDAAWALAVRDEESLLKFRRDLATRIGALQKKPEAPVLERIRPIGDDAAGAVGPLAVSPLVRVDHVRWQVYDDTWAEGLLVEPTSPPQASDFWGVVVPDADEVPEIYAGLTDPGDARSGLAARLAQVGGRILILTTLSRQSTFSGDPKVRYTNLSHREWIWRMGWETGRTPIGYEVDSILAALTILETRAQAANPGQAATPRSFVFGHGEGGRAALIASALDPRIRLAWISGYFRDRDSDGWLEPIDRDIWKSTVIAQDAELAALALQGHPERRVIVDRTAGPIVPGPNPPVNGRDDAADGSLGPIDPAATDRELERARKLAGANASGIVAAQDQSIAMNVLRAELGVQAPERPDKLVRSSAAFDPRSREKRVFDGWAAHTQALVRTSELRRFEFWKAANPLKPAEFEAETVRLRKIFWEEQMGKMPAPTEPMSAASKLVYDEPGFRGYAVKIPVYDDVYAYGVLLLPKDLKPAEKRPVVVCQHGLEGRPDDIVDPSKKSVYHAYGAALADRGYIVFAPQNAYIGNERFRTIQRKAWPLGQSLFAVTIRQHERILDWLGTLENVDKDRIGFYGLSYGGKSAMRIPAVLTRYCLSICSADFNEWIVKCTNTDRQYSYMFTIEYDMYEWDLASRFNYAEMASLIAPRPFMVERGHFDGVAPDEWIGYEFAKVKRTFDLLGVGDKARIAYFNRGHEIDGTESFEFLAEHLRWPRGAAHLKRTR